MIDTPTDEMPISQSQRRGLGLMILVMLYRTSQPAQTRTKIGRLSADAESATEHHGWKDTVQLHLGSLAAIGAPRSSVGGHLLPRRWLVADFTTASTRYSMYTAYQMWQCLLASPQMLGACEGASKATTKSCNAITVHSLLPRASLPYEPACYRNGWPC